MWNTVRGSYTVFYKGLMRNMWFERIPLLLKYKACHIGHVSKKYAAVTDGQVLYNKNDH